MKRRTSDTRVYHNSVTRLCMHMKNSILKPTIKGVRDHVNSFENQTQFPGHIQTVITALLPAVRSAAATSHTGTLAEAATLENIRQNVARLAEATPILSSAVRDNHLKVIGGIYDLGTGRVELLS